MDKELIKTVENACQDNVAMKNAWSNLSEYKETIEQQLTLERYLIIFIGFLSVFFALSFLSLISFTFTSLMFLLHPMSYYDAILCYSIAGTIVFGAGITISCFVLYFVKEKIKKCLADAQLLSDINFFNDYFEDLLLKIEEQEIYFQIVLNSYGIQFVTTSESSEPYPFFERS